MTRSVRAVLFDLDDTLFDHRQCARLALRAVYEGDDALRARPFDAFEQMHAGFLEELHGRVLTGELPLEAARRERFRRLFEAAGAECGEEAVARAAAAYRDGYRRIRQPVTGAAQLLGAVSRRARVGIVSNNLLDEQVEKLQACRLEAFVDALVVSEEAGVSKPDPRIFRIAMDRLDATADETVMVGDSWAADVVGAQAAGIRAIWFNPTGKRAPDPACRVAQLTALDPPEAAIRVIFGE